MRKVLNTLSLHRGERLRVVASAKMLVAGLDGPALFLRLGQPATARGSEHSVGHEYA